MRADAFRRFAPALAENPFRVLGLSPRCSTRDVEREGGKLLALLAAGMDDEPAASGPLGTPPSRTSELVRWAMNELRDPQRRALHEFFWLSGEPLPVDVERVSTLLAGIPLEREEAPSVEAMLQAFAGELIPELTGWQGTREQRARFEQVLGPPAEPPAPPVCFDDLGLPELLGLPHPGGRE